MPARKYLLTLVLSGCTGHGSVPPAPAPNPEPDAHGYTWGDASLALANLYCSTLQDVCGYHIELQVCAEHTAWHLCKPHLTCDTPVDQPTLEVALDQCGAALAASDQSTCYWMRAYGWSPVECHAVLEVEPDL